MSTLKYFLKSQYLSSGNVTETPYLGRFIGSFTSTSNDDYAIEGEMGVPLPPFVAKFSPNLLNGNLLGVADEDGNVRLLDTRKRKPQAIIKEWSAHSNAVFDLAWVNNEPKMITASGDQTARLWDVDKAETISIFRGHTCSLKSVSIQPDSNRVFITGARDGNVLLWDTRCLARNNGFCNPMTTIPNAHVLPPKESVKLSAKKRRSRRASMLQADATQSVTGVVFQDNNTIISCGACDGLLKFWDIRKNYRHEKGRSPVPFHTIENPEKSSRKFGYSSLVLDSTKTKLFAVCTNGVIYEYMTSNLPRLPLHTYSGHSVSSFYVKAAISPDNRFLLCGSSDNNAYIWSCSDTQSQPWVLEGHESEVTSVTWSPHNGEKIVTCSDDNMFKIWRAFQREEKSSSITGKCELKSNPEMNENFIEKQEASVRKRPVPFKETRCSYKPLSLCTHRRIVTRSLGTYKKALFTVEKKLSQSFTSVTPKQAFTSVTPKQAYIHSKKSPVHQTTTPKITKLRSHSVSSSPDVNITPKSCTITPKSSRAFMETWLKSPLVPSLHTPHPPSAEKHVGNKHSVHDASNTTSHVDQTERKLANTSFCDIEMQSDKNLKSINSVEVGNCSIPSNEVCKCTTPSNETVNGIFVDDSSSIAKSRKATNSSKVRKNISHKSTGKRKLKNIENIVNIRLSFTKAGKRIRSPSTEFDRNSKMLKSQHNDKENDISPILIDDVFDRPTQTKRVLDLLDHADGRIQ